MYILSVSLKFCCFLILIIKKLSNLNFREEISAKNRVFNTPRTMYDRLETNARKVLFLRNYEAEMDDGDNHLHQIRFERGVVTPPTTLYTMAAQRMSPQLTPIHSYDFSHLRNEHQVSAIAFFESHNLASQRISIRMFTESNFAKSTAGNYKIVDRQSDGDSNAQLNLDKVKNMGEFHSAFFWMMTLRQRIFPWDHSFSSLLLFLIESEYFIAPHNADGLGRGNMPQGTFCGLFVDYVVHINNSRFTKKLPFLTTVELYGISIQFCRGDSRFKNHNLNPINSNSNGQSSNARQTPSQRFGQPKQQQSQQSQHKPKSVDRRSICDYYNLPPPKKCFRAKLHDGKMCKDQAGFVRKHICAFLLPDGVFCGEPHPEFEHSE